MKRFIFVPLSLPQSQSLSHPQSLSLALFLLLLLVANGCCKPTNATSRTLSGRPTTAAVKRMTTVTGMAKAMSKTATTAGQVDCSAIGAGVSPSVPIRLSHAVVQYFRQHGVRSLILVICQEDIATSVQRQQLRMLVHSFMTAGFYVRVFNGDRPGPVKDDMKWEAPDEHASANFGPPRTFRVNENNNNTLQLLRSFNLKPLSHKSGILVVNFGTSCALNLLRWSAASENNFFATNRFWLLLAANEEQLYLLEDQDIFLPPDSEVRVLLWPRTESNTAVQFQLIDVYKVAANKPLKRRFISATPLRSVACMLNALRRFGSAISYRENLEGISFRTGLVVAFPDLFTNIEDLSLRHIDTISKVNNRITRELANKLNLTFNTYQTDNYGWRKPNGSFDGLMGRFQRYELDFAQLAIFMRLERVALCDFVAETFHVRAGLMFRQPPLSAVANIFAMPFDTYVWLAILLLMIFTVIVFVIELMFSPHNHEMNILDCIVFVWGAMCQQGFYVNVSNRSARVIVFTTFVATLFLFTSFSANIVALLQSPSEAIHTLSDLSQSPLEIGMQDTQYNKIFFTESTDPVATRLYHKKIAPKGDNIYMRPAIGMEKIRTGLFAYQVEFQAGYQIISDTFNEAEKCGLKQLEPFQLPMLALPTRKNFPYKELFRRQLRWQREVGLMNREERKWIPQKPKCENGMSGFVSIGLTECRYALAMFGFGLLLGVCVFLLEIGYKRAMQNKHIQHLAVIANLSFIEQKCY